MSGRSTMAPSVAWLSVLLLASSAGCAPARPALPSCPVGVEGVVRTVGAAPDVRYVIEDDGESALIARGQAGHVANAEGLTVEVCAAPTGHGEIGVLRFEAVALDGRPVADGRLQWTGEGWFVDDPDGAVRLPEPIPAALKQLQGHRVWVRLDGLSVGAWGRLD